MSRKLKVRNLSKDKSDTWGFVSDFKAEKKCGECWLTKHAPKTKNDLAVHKRKIESVAAAIQDALTTQRHKVLILSGPSGTGKSATVRALSHDLGFQMEEWYNPIQYYEQGVLYESEISKFKSFLQSSSRYSSIFSSKQSATSRKVVLIEDLPTFASLKETEFWDIIKAYSKTGVHPIILIISGNVYNIPFEYINLSFNPVAPTLLTKALNKIADAEHTLVSVSDIVLQSEGDLRNAILALQFDTITSSKAFNKERGKRRKLLKKTDGYKKDTPLFIFRALGKLLYAKRKDGTPLDCDDATLARSELEFIPEEVTEQCVLSCDMITQFLHHNYLGFQTNIDNVLLAAHTMCDSDILSSSWVDSHFNQQMLSYASSIAARAVVFCKDTAFVPKFTPLCKPVQRETDNKCFNNKRRCMNAFALEHKGTNSSFIVDTLPYLKKIGHKPKDPEQYNLMHKLTQFSASCKSGKSLGDKELISEQMICEADDFSQRDDGYILQSKDLESEIAEFSD